MILVSNKRARFDYQLSKKYRAGIVLIGSEVKSMKLKHASLQGSFIKIIGGEAFLINAQINPYQFANNQNYDPKRNRKLLLSKKEIDQLATGTKQKGWAIIPLSFELIGRQIKVNLAVGKGSQKFEKREKIKRRDLKRELERKNKTARLKI